jgi:Anti-sigma-K factor rskA/Putative zinc-finger
MPRFLSWRALPWITGHALAGPYALDALDAAERARFERHLRRCATCPADVRGFAAVAASLGLAAATTPPPALKGRVLADVAALDAARSADAEVAAVLSAADARIASAATSAGGTATVVASRRDGTVVFTSSGLPALPPSSVYELWFIGSAGVRAAGLVPAPEPAGAAGGGGVAGGMSR